MAAPLRQRLRSRSRFAVTVAVAAVACFACTYTPLEDAYVDAAFPTQNFGSSAQLRVDDTPLQTSYLKFDVTIAPADGTAVLRVHTESAGTDLSAYAVADNSWSESTITAANAPPLGALLDTLGPIEAGKVYRFDVSDHVNAEGVVSFALRTSGSSSIRLTSSEGVNQPELETPAPASPSPFIITRDGSTYTATGQGGEPVYTGSAKTVVEAAVSELDFFGNGSIIFSAGTFDFGTDHLELADLDGVEFAGQGIGVTTLVNNTSEADDTEIFDVVGADGVTIRDMTVAANGATRTTSDAIDFDNGNNTTIERVEVTGSRGRGIVFDGKGDGWSADGNTIRDCVISGVPGDGIELLAASNNTITGCSITGVGGHGIQATKASTMAVQPNKPSNDNLITGNTIDQAGIDGININSGDDNQVISNTVTNSSDVVANHDGIRIQSSSSVPCDGNEVTANTATDNQPTKTQRYGLNISSSLCTANIVGPGNDFAGNKTGAINDLGTGTVYL